jgi:IS605 OrfB family transposase
VDRLREIAAPFVASAPAGARVRTRLRVSPGDAAVLRAVGSHLGSLAGRDLAARCAEGRLDAKGRTVSRRERKRALTAGSSSRWAGTITRVSEDQWHLADRNLHAERASLRARVRRIEARAAVPAGEKTGRVRGYAASAERHAKGIRLQALKGRLARVERRLESGRVSVTRGGRDLLRKRLNLAAADLTEAGWREEWEAARLFLTADGEAGKPWGNETIRFNPDEEWLEIKLPAPLAHLANRPYGRYRLSCPVAFSYRGDEVAAQAATGAVRYDITLDPVSTRWYLDASWTIPLRPAPSLEELRRFPVISADLNAGHLAVAVAAPDGNVLGVPFTVPLELAGLPAATRDGRLRNAISRLIAAARQHGARAIVIEDLDFTEARTEGRERHGNRPSRGKRGRAFRRMVSGIPTGKLRDRLVQMTANAGLHVIVVDPAYSSRWGAGHWLAPLRAHHPQATGHHAAALVLGRRGLGHRAGRRANGNRTAPEDAARPAPARPRKPPAAGPAPKKPATPRGPRQPPGTKTGRPHRIMAGDQAAQDRTGPPAPQDYVLHARLGTVRFGSCAWCAANPAHRWAAGDQICTRCLAEEAQVRPGNP